MQLLTEMTSTRDADMMSAAGLVDRSTAAADDVVLWPDAETPAAMGHTEAVEPCLRSRPLQVA